MFRLENLRGQLIKSFVFFCSLKSNKNGGKEQLNGSSAHWWGGHFDAILCWFVNTSRLENDTCPHTKNMWLEKQRQWPSNLTANVADNSHPAVVDFLSCGFYIFSTSFHSASMSCLSHIYYDTYPSYIFAIKWKRLGPIVKIGSPIADESRLKTGTW